MEKTLVSTGKTIDLAIESALAQLGLERDDITYQVLALPKAGFLGFGAQPAKVIVTYEVPDPVVVEKPQAPKSALGSASRSKPKAAAPVKKPEAPKAEAPKQEAPKAEAPKSAAPKAEKPQAPKQEKPKAPKQEKKPAEPKAPKAEAPRVYTPAEPGSVEEKIETFLKGLLEHMDSKAIPHAWKENENTYMVELVGEDLGYLIGRRGDTLDAIQYLTGYAVNHGRSHRVRIYVDAEKNIDIRLRYRDEYMALLKFIEGRAAV